MRIAYIAAGAAGMYCGTCIHDNMLAKELIHQGHEVALIPTYTPLRTDDEDVSLGHIFFGGINVYLQEKSAFFRNTPWLIDRLLDTPSLLNSLSKFSASTSAKDLGSLTVSMLKGENGRQKKELEKLVQWLKNDYMPDIIQLTNSMFSGMAAQFKSQLNVPVICGFQGEDIFLEQLIEPYKSESITLLREKTNDIDGFFASCNYYADYMSEYTHSDREKVHVIPLGLNLEGHGNTEKRLNDHPFTIGYMARICPEKGLHLLIEAFHQLAKKWGKDNVRLKVAGYLGGRDKEYYEQIVHQLKNWNIQNSFEYLGVVDRGEKIQFLNQIHVLSVPTVYRESKGLFVLESLANGVPVVLPNHGSFPELIETTSGGILVEPLSTEAINKGLTEIMQNPKLRKTLGQKGKESVHQKYTIHQTGVRTLAVLNRYLS